MNRLLRFFTAGLCALLLSSCASIALDTEELMRPPKLSESQSEVYNALISALGTSGVNVSLRYPRSGDYRSAFTFYDLTGDGQDEAIVFYSLANDESSSYVNILSRDSGSWQSVCDVSGLGPSIGSVEFASLSRNDDRDMVIGWEQEDDTTTLSVLRFDGTELRSLYEANYTRYSIANLDNSGLDELIVVSMSTSGRRPFAALVLPDINTLSAVSHVQFNPNMDSFSQLMVGRLGTGKVGLLVDGTVDDQLATEVILYEDGKLVLPFARSDPFYTETARNNTHVLCADANGDGILEIPVQTLAPGQYEAGDTELQYYTTYYQLGEQNELIPTSTVYINQDQGYTLTLPAGWINDVTVTVQKSTGEVRFTVFDADDSIATVDLLKIRVYSQKDYQDKFDTDQYIQIGRKGIFRYYASLTAPEHPLALTQQQLESLFKLS